MAGVRVERREELRAAAGEHLVRPDALRHRRGAAVHRGRLQVRTVDQRVDVARRADVDDAARRAADEARFNAEAAAVAADDRRAAQAKASRCNAAQSDKATNDRRVARYQDWGWQNSQNQARAERETAERRMRDHCD